MYSYSEIKNEEDEVNFSLQDMIDGKIMNMKYIENKSVLDSKLLYNGKM